MEKKETSLQKVTSHPEFTYPNVSHHNDHISDILLSSLVALLMIYELPIADFEDPTAYV